jgi:hypothetical protein
MKARHRRIVFFSVLSVFLALILAIVIVPPMFNIEKLRPGFEQALLSQTGIPAKINGKINISLLGRVNVAAHDVRLPDGRADSVMFAIPLRKIFDINSAPLSGKIYVDGARLDIQGLHAPVIASRIEIRDSIVRFMGNDYNIVSGALENGGFKGSVRAGRHKYFVETRGAGFSVLNKNEGLEISGTFLADGTAAGLLSIDTGNINEWFGFFEPDIYEHVKLDMNFVWDGKQGFRFENIRGNVGGDDFTGSVELGGRNKFQFFSNAIDFDLSFLLSQKSLLTDSDLDLDLRGRLKFADSIYNRVKLSAAGAGDKIIISGLEFENDGMKGSMNGEITGNGAQSLALRFFRGDAEVYCLFSGTPETWRCDEYEYADKDLSAKGALTVAPESFSATLSSQASMPENFDFSSALDFLGPDGSVEFEFADAGGKIEIRNKRQRIAYSFAKDRRLGWPGGGGFEFLPESMRAGPGLLKWDGGKFYFIPNAGGWELTAEGNSFALEGSSAKKLLRAFYPALELPFADDFPYEVSGKYFKPYIRDLEIRVAGHVFRGSAGSAGIALKTDMLDLDEFANFKYFEDYEESQFLSDAPILAPFGMTGISLSLSAAGIIRNGEKYDNFVYSLRDGAQDFSISDDARGSLLVSLKKNGGAVYEMLVRLNRFAFVGKLLESGSPLNISDSVATGQAVLSTGGKIAHDFWRNMKGTLELGFDGGVLNGIGTDAFYAGAESITRMNAEDAIAHAASGGDTRIKSLRISGEYDNGDFRTTRKFHLSAWHAEMTGDLRLTDGKLDVRTNILLRGAAPDPQTFSLTIRPNGERSYSLSEIMSVFDPDYLSEFVRKHSRK